MADVLTGTGTLAPADLTAFMAHVQQAAEVYQDLVTRPPQGMTAEQTLRALTRIPSHRLTTGLTHDERDGLLRTAHRSAPITQDLTTETRIQVAHGTSPEINKNQPNRIHPAQAPAPVAQQPIQETADSQPTGGLLNHEDDLWMEVNRALGRPAAGSLDREEYAQALASAQQSVSAAAWKRMTTRERADRIAVAYSSHGRFSPGLLGGVRGGAGTAVSSVAGVSPMPLTGWFAPQGDGTMSATLTPTAHDRVVALALRQDDPAPVVNHLVHLADPASDRPKHLDDIDAIAVNIELIEILHPLADWNNLDESWSDPVRVSDLMEFVAAVRHVRTSTQLSGDRLAVALDYAADFPSEQDSPADKATKIKRFTDEIRDSVVPSQRMVPSARDIILAGFLTGIQPSDPEKEHRQGAEDPKELLRAELKQIETAVRASTSPALTDILKRRMDNVAEDLEILKDFELRDLSAVAQEQAAALVVVERRGRQLLDIRVRELADRMDGEEWEWASNYPDDIEDLLPEVHEYMHSKMRITVNYKNSRDFVRRTERSGTSTNVPLTNAWQVGSRPASYMEHRGSIEEQFGYAAILRRREMRGEEGYEPESRHRALLPKYGALSFPDRPQGLRGYGNLVFHLRQEIRDYCTFSSQDSYDNEGLRGSRGAVGPNHIVSLLANSRGTMVRKIFAAATEFRYDPAAARIVREQDRYVEAHSDYLEVQIHGDIPWSMVDRIVRLHDGDPTKLREAVEDKAWFEELRDRLNLSFEVDLVQLPPLPNPLLREREVASPPPLFSMADDAPIGSGQADERTLHDDPEDAAHRESELLARQIESEFGIHLDSDAGVAAVKKMHPGAPENEKDEVKPLPWTVELLKSLHAAMKNYAPILGSRRTHSSRGSIAQEITVVGHVKTALNENASYFSAAGEYIRSHNVINIYTVAHLGGKLEATATHELAHGLLRYALPDFTREFWEGVEAPWKDISPEHDFQWSIAYFIRGSQSFFSKAPRHAHAIEALQAKWPNIIKKQPAESAFAAAQRAAATLIEELPWFIDQVGTWEAGRPRLRFPKERPITAYGAKNSDEDLAETSRFYFGDNAFLRQNAPLRAEFFDRLIQGWNQRTDRLETSDPSDHHRSPIGLLDADEPESTPARTQVGETRSAVVDEPLASEVPTAISSTVTGPPSTVTGPPATTHSQSRQPTTHPDDASGPGVARRSEQAAAPRAFLDTPRGLTARPRDVSTTGPTAATPNGAAGLRQGSEGPQPHLLRDEPRTHPDALTTHARPHSADQATPDREPVQPLRRDAESHHYLLDTELLPAADAPEYTEHVKTAAATLRGLDTTPVVSIAGVRKTDPLSAIQATDFLRAIIRLPHTPSTIRFDLGHAAPAPINICR